MLSLFGPHQSSAELSPSETNSSQVKEDQWLRSKSSFRVQHVGPGQTYCVWSMGPDHMCSHERRFTVHWSNIMHLDTLEDNGTLCPLFINRHLEI